MIASLKKKVTKKKEESVSTDSKITIKEVKKRSVLNEGRSTGIGYAFLKKIDDSTFETVNPISPCKDYLCEVVLTENTGIGTHGCGLSYPKKNDIFSGKKAYLAALVQKSKGGSENHYMNFIEETKLLKANAANTAKLMNYFEEKLGFNERTEVKEANDDMFLVEMPIEWAQSLHATSLYTLLHRLAIHYDGTTDVMDWLTKYSTEAKEDSYNMKCVLPKINQIIKNPELLREPGYVLENAKAYMNKTTGVTSWSPHGMGIMSVNLNDIK